MPKIFIFALSAMTAVTVFWLIHRSEFSLRLKDNVFGSFYKCALFNITFLGMACLAAWELYNAITRYTFFIKSRGYPTRLVTPDENPVEFVWYLLIFSMLLGSGIAFTIKALPLRQKV